MSERIDPLRNNGKPWSDEDLELLQRLYPHDSNATLGRIFGRSAASIQNTANPMGLRKSPEFMASAPGRFAPGQKAWNKGMKGISIGGVGTRFQKGHRPHNWEPIGHEMEIAGYLYRKVADGGLQRENYRPVQHLVWEEHTGQPVPEGHTVVFRDGNNRNFDPANLELVTRAELLSRNSHWNNLPPELAQIVQLRGALTRKINRRSQTS